MNGLNAPENSQMSLHGIRPQRHGRSVRDLITTMTEQSMVWGLGVRGGNTKLKRGKDNLNCNK